MKTTIKFIYFIIISAALSNLFLCSKLPLDPGREKQVGLLKSKFPDENFRIRFAEYPTIFVKNIRSFDHVCNTTNLEIMWIQDLSESFSSWSNLLTELADNLLENIIPQYSNVSISISGFTDRKTSRAKTTPDMCYHHFLNFTSSRKKVRDAMSKFKFVPCGGQREDSLSAIYLAANWKYHQSSDSPKNPLLAPTRIVVLVTDAEGKLAKNVNKVDDVSLPDMSRASIQNFCDKNTIPTVNMLKEKLRKEEIILAIVAPKSVERFYNNLLFEMQVPGGVYSFQDITDQKLHLGDIIDRSSCAAEHLRSPVKLSALASKFPELSYLHNESQHFDMLPLVGHRKRNCSGFSCNQNNRTIQGALSQANNTGTTGKRIVLIVGSAGVLILLSALSTLWHLRKDRVEKDESVVFTENPSVNETHDRENLVSAELGAFA